MGKRVYSALRTDPLRKLRIQQEQQRQLVDLFTNPPPPPAPRPEPEHVHTRGVGYLAGCPQCQAINRAYYHAHKPPTGRSYKRKKT